MLWANVHCWESCRPSFEGFFFITGGSNMTFDQDLYPLPTGRFSRWLRIGIKKSSMLIEFTQVYRLKITSELQGKQLMLCCKILPHFLDKVVCLRPWAHRTWCGGIYFDTPPDLVNKIRSVITLRLGSAHRGDRSNTGAEGRASGSLTPAP